MLNRQSGWRFGHLLLQLSNALLKTCFLGHGWREQTRLNTGVFFLMVDHQQGLGQVEAVVRAAVALFGFRQVFETGDQIVSKQPAKEHRFAFIFWYRDQVLQQAEGIED